MTLLLCCLVKQNAVPGGSAPIPSRSVKEEYLTSRLSAEFQQAALIIFLDVSQPVVDRQFSDTSNFTKI